MAQKKKEGINVKMADCVQPLKVADLKEAEMCMIRLAQHKYMLSELLEKLSQESSRSETRSVNASLAWLDPLSLVNSDGIICVGGRLRNSREEENRKCPLILPEIVNLKYDYAPHASISCSLWKIHNFKQNPKVTGWWAQLC